MTYLLLRASWALLVDTRDGFIASHDDNLGPPQVKVKSPFWISGIEYSDEPGDGYRTAAKSRAISTASNALMELYQLRSFVAVADLGQLTRAAERLHLSQPAVSAQIKALEDELATALFERGAGGMTLTPAGRHLLPHAERVLAAAQALRGEAQALRGEVTGRIRLGTVGDPELTRLPEVLRRAVDRFPLLEIDVRQEVSGAAFAKVRDGELDAAFYYGGLAHPAVAALPLARLTFRVVVPAAWAERLGGADWEAIAAEPWIMTPAISTHHALATELFAVHGVAPVRQVEADHEAVISSLVAAGLGVALLREEMATADAVHGDIAIWGDTRLAACLSFIYRRERELEPGIGALRDVVRDVFPLPDDSAPGPAPTGTTAGAGRSNPPDSGGTE